jgi:3-deoxy-D-arabino-heptulosonate 7-phosphate (DAHP) synthase
MRRAGSASPQNRQVRTTTEGKLMADSVIANLVLAEEGYNSEVGTTSWTLAMVINGVQHRLMEVTVPTSRDDEQEAAAQFAKRIRERLA